MATKKQEVKAVEENVPAFLQGQMGDMRGSEEVGAEDLVIPRVELVQGLSKARKKADPAYIQGAEEGMFYNNVTRELYGDTFEIVPVMFKKEWLLWRDADLGGGFAGAYGSQQEAEEARQQQEKPEEWEVVDTNQHFVLIVKDDVTIEEAVISMAKTKAKASRLLNSLVRINGGPRFSRRYRVKGVPAQNNSGQDYYTLTVENVGFVTEDQFRAAEKVYEMVKSGAASVDRSTEDLDTGDGGEF